MLLSLRYYCSFFGTNASFKEVRHSFLLNRPADHRDDAAVGKTQVSESYVRDCDFDTSRFSAVRRKSGLVTLRRSMWRGAKGPVWAAGLLYQRKR